MLTPEAEDGTKSIHRYLCILPLAGHPKPISARFQLDYVWSCEGTGFGEGFNSFLHFNPHGVETDLKISGADLRYILIW